MIRKFSINYAPTFIRMYKSLSVELKEEIKFKIDLFKDEKNHTLLKVHKLKGELKGCYSFSVNYKIRIVFEYADKDSINLLYVGSHDEVY